MLLCFFPYFTWKKISLGVYICPRAITVVFAWDIICFGEKQKKNAIFILPSNVILALKLIEFVWPYIVFFCILEFSWCGREKLDGDKWGYWRAITLLRNAISQKRRGFSYFNSLWRMTNEKLLWKMHKLLERVTNVDLTLHGLWMCRFLCLEKIVKIFEKHCLHDFWRVIFQHF